MKSTILAVIFGVTGLQILFYSRTLKTLLGKGSTKFLKYPHTSL